LPSSRSEVLVEAGRLAAEGRPYALATVVRVVRPASTRRGDRALVTPDGALAGWVGGACSEPIVVREALRALADGEPRLVQIGPAGSGVGAPDDVVVAESRCASEGVVEVLIEPELPGPLLAVLGEGVAGRTLVQLARIVGWRVTDQLDPDTAADAVVVATMGHGDEDALASALKAGVGYVGLVASARRAAVVLDALRERGIGAEELARVRSPAGRDLGPSTQEEIAVAILAELVDWRHGLVPDRPGDHPGGPPDPPDRPGDHPPDPSGLAPAAPTEAVDPVCGMTVAVAGAPTAVREGVTWYFCSVGCRDHFESTGGP
jgi:xanthine dehydrogenase accessory factor